MLIAYCRPVVILGFNKDTTADDLLFEFPNKFGTCVPYTTRTRRKGEVEGKDYHFVVTRSTMEKDIQEHKYIEAGEYNGNLYGTHIQSVFDVADSGLHCLLDIGAPAVRRLEAAGLSPISILVCECAAESEAELEDKTDEECQRISFAQTRMRKKVAQIIQEHAPILTGWYFLTFYLHLVAIVTEKNYELVYQRIKSIIKDNSGPRIWIEANPGSND
ncbi:Disks large 4 [Cichlidogyrus casuarinus]|uniref:Disks large 4 n=1 Tax=Cichlidogyrus casuarinus TaxID=1844966 RepID=A0ABD2PTV6_9PLAT